MVNSKLFVFAILCVVVNHITFGCLNGVFVLYTEAFSFVNFRVLAVSPSRRPVWL